MRSSLAATLLIVLAVLVPVTVIFGCRKSKSKKDNFKSKAEKLIGKYKDVDPLCPSRSIAILTYTDSVESIRTTVDSLLAQTCSVNQIVMTIPWNGQLHLPPELKKILNIYESGKDYGEIGDAIVPTLLREADADTILVLVKTGIAYNKNLLRELLGKYQERNAAVFQHDCLLLSTRMLSPTVLDDKTETLEQLKQHVIR